MRDTSFKISEVIKEEAWSFPDSGKPTGLSVSARTKNQKLYLKEIKENPLTLGIGPAGTGKSFLAVAAGLIALEKGQVERLVLTRPAISAGEKLGFLPGTATEKLDPYLRPLYDSIRELKDGARVPVTFTKDDIEIAPLSFMRGRTLKNSFVILDEAQNATEEQMLMFLTRFGEGSKYVVTGDPDQSDLVNKNSGLIESVRTLEGVPGVSIVRLDESDIVRHPLVSRIVTAYAKARNA